VRPERKEKVYEVVGNVTGSVYTKFNHRFHQKGKLNSMKSDFIHSAKIILSQKMKSSSNLFERKMKKNHLFVITILLCSGTEVKGRGG